MTPAHADPAVPASGKAGIDTGIRPVDYQQEEAQRAAPAEQKSDRYPIDLATAFRLTGANNLQIALATERVQQARARLAGAKALWLPSLTGGVGYSQHDGQFQEAAGNVDNLPRSSVFVGGGASLGNIGLAGAAQQPRMTVGLSPADTLFTPLSERQNVRGAGAALTTTFNDTLLQVASAYLDLLQAQAQVAIAREAVTNAEELDQLVGANVRAGRAPPADGLRARAELADRRRQVHLAEEGVHVTSAELVRLLRLDPAVTLTPAEDQPVAVTFVETESPLSTLIVQAFTHRPELVQQRAQVQAALARLRQEQLRPFIPTIQLAYGAGGFGGDPGASVSDLAGRDDFDAMLVWELRNLGFGNLALTRERASLHSQAELSVAETGDRIAAEVARAYYQARESKLQIEAARDQVQAAAEAMPLNFTGIRGGELRAIEAQQAIQMLVYARSQYLAALIDFNRAQYSLLRAVGVPPDAPSPPPGPGG
jgi:outer membrane protein TolC